MAITWSTFVSTRCFGGCQKRHRKEVRWALASKNLLDSVFSPCSMPLSVALCLTLFGQFEILKG